MKYKSLIHSNREYNRQSDIEDILSRHGFNWLIDAEFENAEIEVKNDTILWHSGTWYSGNFKYGIWLNGDFKWGTFENGIWENGNFNGKFLSGIFKDGNMNGETTPQ